MNQHTLRIQAYDQPTVMEKLLQVARYRGFTVTGMTMYPSDDKMLDIQLSVRSHHAIEQLQNQLNKLIDIANIKVDNSSSQQCRA